MAAVTYSDPNMLGGPRGPRRKRSPITFGRILVVVGIGLALILVWTLIGKQTVSDRTNAMKTTRVILPPPPPPPPPAVTPQETPPERLETRRVGDAWVSTRRTRGSPH